MAEGESWGLVLVDEDEMRYALTGMLVDDAGLNRRVADEQQKGRSVKCFPYQLDKEEAIVAWAARMALCPAPLEEILEGTAS